MVWDRDGESPLALNIIFVLFQIKILFTVFCKQGVGANSLRNPWYVTCLFLRTFVEYCHLLRIYSDYSAKHYACCEMSSRKQSTCCFRSVRTQLLDLNLIMVAEDLKPKVGQADPEPKLAGDQGGEQSVPTTNAEPKDKGGEDAAKPGGKEEVVLTKDSDPELFKLKKDEVHRGDILFLPDSDDRTAYTGVSLHHLPEGIPGHPIVVLAIFPNDYVWFLLVSHGKSPYKYTLR